MTVKKVKPVATKANKEKEKNEKLQEAFELLQKEKQTREQAAVNEYNQMVEHIEKKYNVRLSISNPTVIISSL